MPIDPKLLRRAGTLLTFLQSPRTNEQILTWARDRCMAERRVDELFRLLTHARLVQREPASTFRAVAR